MDTALKQRLIGAVVLVALAVIFLPMLIRGPAPDSGASDVSLAVPGVPGGQYETRELPLVTPGTAPAGGVIGLDNSAPAGNSAPSSADAAALAQPVTDPASAAMLPATTAGGSLAVNFGAYATTADADAVIARLKQSDLPAYREPATINGKTAYRVRIGPYADRADAEAVRLQASQVRSDVKAVVVTLDAPTPSLATAQATQPVAGTPPATTQALPPEPAAKPSAPTPAPKPVSAERKPAPVPAPAAPAAADVGFAVQVGAFSQVADAHALRDRLRGQGFSAFVQQVQTDKGTLHRVRVGPAANRADADALKSQLSAQAGLQGMVSPHP
ncbi:MAG: SPOR domain-containing protein [Pseudoxanthomonas sp.]|nr:SPOR domain-containing protein [Pseudoxanthomonas sp.]